MELRPLGGDMGLETGVLQTGHYAFIREGSRHDTTPWSELGIDGNTGRIIYKNLKDGSSNICNVDDTIVELPKECFYKENTYIVLEFNTATSSLPNDTKQMLYKDLIADISGSATPISLAPIPEKTLEDLASGLSKLRNSDALRQEIKILESKDNLQFENNSSVESFIYYWYEKDSDNNLKYDLDDEETKQIVKIIGQLISSCEKDQNKIISLMENIRGRIKVLSATEKSNLFTALSCQYKT
jgi:hypothetical protein